MRKLIVEGRRIYLEDGSTRQDIGFLIQDLLDVAKRFEASLEGDIVELRIDGHLYAFTEGQGWRKFA